MTKQRSKAGFSLLEMMAALMILVLMTAAMGTTMSAGLGIYREAIFESDSASMAGIINTSLGDILRYSMNVKENESYPGNLKDTSLDSQGQYILQNQTGFFFTSIDYGIRDAYFHLSTEGGGQSGGILQLRNLKNAETVELVNTGAYPDLKITAFTVTYVPKSATSRGGYFLIDYTISSTKTDSLTREVSTVVRLMNEE